MVIQAVSSPSRWSRLQTLVSSDEDPRWDRLALAALVLGALARALVVFVLHPPHHYVYSDMQGYVSRAMQVASGVGALPRALALSPPGTHLLLAAPLKLFGVDSTGLRWADAMWFGFSALAPVLVWRLVRGLLGPLTGAITAALCAFAPLFILYAGFFTSETPSLALLAGALWLGYRSRSARPWPGVVLGTGGGILGAALVATRPQFILNLVLVMVALLRSSRTRWRGAVGFAFGLIAVLAVVVAVNSSNTGHLTGISENGAITFFQAQCNIHTVSTGRSPGPVLFFANPVAGELRRGRDAHFSHPFAWDQGFYYNQGLNCIAKDGVGHVFILARDLADLTATSTPWPLTNEIAIGRIGDIANVLYSAALLLALILVAVVRRHWPLDHRSRDGTATLLAHLAMVAPVAMIFGSEPRYRVPYDIFGLALLAWLIATALRRRAGAGGS